MGKNQLLCIFLSYIFRIYYSLLESSTNELRNRYIKDSPEAFNYKMSPTLKISSVDSKYMYSPYADYFTSLSSKATYSFQLINNHNDSQVPVRLIDANGDMLGIFPLKDAYHHAKNQNMDLVEISRDATPKVCKILDYGKFNYQKQKQDKVHFLKQRSQCMKEIHVTSRIADNDLRIKCQNAIRFLNSGNQVKLSLFLRGREKNHPELASKIFDKALVLLQGFGQAQKETYVGGVIYQIYSPKSHHSKSGKTIPKISNVNPMRQ